MDVKMERKKMKILREEICGGKYLKRMTEHYKTINQMIEEEDKNGYEVVGLFGMMTILPGSDEYTVLFKRTAKKQKQNDEMKKLVDYPDLIGDGDRTPSS